MSGSANNSGYGAASPYNSPWGPGAGWSGGWDYWRCWHTAKPLWIAAMILGFIFWWPIGLILLFTGMWGKRMAYWSCSSAGFGWQGPQGGWQGPQQGPWNGGPPPWAGWKSYFCGERRERPAPHQASSGNHAFDEYRAETLRRLEDEQKEFAAFLERLRFAKDKAEFDQFMAERRGRPPAPTENGQPQG